MQWPGHCSILLPVKYILDVLHEHRTRPHVLSYYALVSVILFVVYHLVRYSDMLNQHSAIVIIPSYVYREPIVVTWRCLGILVIVPNIAKKLMGQLRQKNFQISGLLAMQKASRSHCDGPTLKAWTWREWEEIREPHEQEPTHNPCASDISRDYWWCHQIIYIYKSFFLKIESPYSWIKNSNWYGLTKKLLAESILDHSNGYLYLLDWTAGMDYWNGLLYWTDLFLHHFYDL